MSDAAPGAVVFTDIVGFTELTDSHGDDLALLLLERQDREVKASLPPGARIVKELGDGLLLWFERAGEAVTCTVGIQRGLRGVTVEGIPLWLRAGIHWGCPRRRGEDLIGRDVNLASRICGLAAPGEVLCSGATAVAAGHLPGVRFEHLGPVFVRGVADPVPLLRAVTTVPAGLSATGRLRLPTGR